MPRNKNAEAGSPDSQTPYRSPPPGADDAFLPEEGAPAGGSKPQTLADMGDDLSRVANAATEQIGEAASTLGGTARDAARATFRAVSDQASVLTSNVAAELTTVAETEKSRGADAILGFARAIDRASSELSDQSPQIARAFRSAAESVESFSDNLRGERIGDLIAAGSDYAKRQPLAFFASALVAGFAASRFLLSHKPSGQGAPLADVSDGPDFRSGQ